jgi:molybdenum cofactor biosynthesis protein B
LSKQVKYVDYNIYGDRNVSQAVIEHRRAAREALNIAVVTVSDTRSLETDTSGATIVVLAEEVGHRIVDRRILRDEPAEMTSLFRSLCARDDLDAILVTGGTGISPRDQTYETVSALLTKPLPGYGELFRMLSYADIGPACILSRAVGGLIGSKVVLVMPGSRAAVELAMRKIILPELPHIVREATKS